MKTLCYKKFRRGSLRIHLIPILVWLIALTFVVMLFSRFSLRKYEILGIARGQICQISSTCSGRLIDVPVELFQNVTQGQTLAVIDNVLENEPLKEQLWSIQAEIERLMAELLTIQDSYIAENTDRKLEYDTNKRRLALDIENARLKMFEIKATIASDRILLADLNIELETSKELLKQDVISKYEKERVQAQYQSLLEKIHISEQLLLQAEADMQICMQRYKQYSQHEPYYPSVDNAIDVIYKAIHVQEKLMNELFARLAPHKLTSPIDGVIIPIAGNQNEVTLYRPGENILRNTGEVITEGESVFAVAENKPSEIVAYIDDTQSAFFKKGMPVEIIKQNQPAQIAKSQIAYISPVVEKMPERLWLNPEIPQWGRALLIKIHPDLKASSGEILRIRVL